MLLLIPFPLSTTGQHASVARQQCCSLLLWSPRSSNLVPPSAPHSHDGHRGMQCVPPLPLPLSGSCSPALAVHSTSSRISAAGEHTSTTLMSSAGQSTYPLPPIQQQQQSPCGDERGGVDAAAAGCLPPRHGPWLQRQNRTEAASTSYRPIPISYSNRARRAGCCAADEPVAGTQLTYAAQLCPLKVCMTHTGRVCCMAWWQGTAGRALLRLGGARLGL